MDVLFDLPDDCDIAIDDEMYDQYIEFSGNQSLLKLKVTPEHLRALAGILAEYGYCSIDDSHV